MYITPIFSANQNTKSKTSIQKSVKSSMVSFCQSEKSYTLEEMLGANAVISSVVNPYINKRKSEITYNLTNQVITEFKKETQQKLNDYEKTRDFDSKIQLLNKVAENYMKSGNFEKAGVITAFTMKEIFNNPKLSEEEKKKQITSEDNLYNLRRTFNTPTDPKARLYVAKTMNKIGYKEFLPITENICENFVNEDKKVLFEAKKLINKHYDLSKLNSFLNKSDDYYQVVAMKLIAKWGLAEQTDLILPFLQNPNNVSKLHAKGMKIHAIQALGMTRDDRYISVLANNFNQIRTSFIQDMVRDPIITAISLMDNQEKQINFIAPLLDGQKGDVEYTASKVISRMGNAKILPVLENKLRKLKSSKLSPDDLNYKYEISKNLINAIVEINKREGTINKLLLNSDVEIRKAAELETRKIEKASQSNNNIDKLLNIVVNTTNDKELRKDALNDIANTANYLSVNELLPLVKDKDIAYEAFKTIVNISRKEQNGLLIKVLKDNYKLFEPEYYDPRDDMSGFRYNNIPPLNNLFTNENFDLLKSIVKNDCMNEQHWSSPLHTLLVSELGTLGRESEHANNFVSGGDLYLKYGAMDSGDNWKRHTAREASFEAFAKIFLRGDLIWAVDKK